ncbi:MULTISPECIES: GntR family transcriptional regulator [Clostridia]|uniref:GntR family transcriptional regulator n=1 Tax=Clostridia TaxID=186801 RepID=UPI000EA1A3B1|nr:MULTISPECIES: GntR family transcriptional regulator [Clostridia]NBJ70007.1 GntR family transcriptional regulator [Roseburia sp. 1XD42-34]RKI77374.1 GntR family transcriptional regulator [Clostridium sp. 1xD42-85]
MTSKKFYPEKGLAFSSSMGERLVTELRMRIISQAIQKETVLSENQLAKEYRVSRSPVREALKVLEKEQLIRLERMGAIVIGISETDIEEIYDIRLMIESFVIQRLLHSENDALLNELNKILEMMKIAIKYKDIDEFSLKDIEFHETIIKSIHHRQIMMVWTHLRPVMECLIILSMRYRSQVNDQDFNRILKNHELIIEALAQKEKALIKEAFFKNFHDVQNKAEDLWTDPEMMKKAREFNGS